MGDREQIRSLDKIVMVRSHLLAKEGEAGNIALVRDLKRGCIYLIGEDLSADVATRLERQGAAIRLCVSADAPESDHLTFEKLRLTNAGRCKRWHGDAGVDDWSLTDWALAAFGELGEACNIIKKLNRDDSGMVGNPIDQDRETLIAMLAEEVADTVIYLDLLAQRAGIALGPSVKRKFNKVSVRNDFPERL